MVHADYTFWEDTLQLVRGKRLHESASESTDYIVCSHLTWQESKECKILGGSANEGIQGLAKLLTISSHGLSLKQEWGCFVKPSCSNPFFLLASLVSQFGSPTQKGYEFEVI